MRSWLAPLCALGLLLSAATAAAAPSLAERETARSLMEEGDRLMAQGDARNALTKYQAAHAIMHVPTTGLDVARAHAQLGQLVEARGVAIEVVNAAPAANEPKVFTDARQAASELAEQLETRVPTISVKVTPADGAHSVMIDDTRLPQAARDVAFRTNPGSHTVQVELPGSAPQRRTVTLQEGQVAVVPFELPQTLAAAVPPPSAANEPSLQPQAAPEQRPLQQPGPFPMQQPEQRPYTPMPSQAADEGADPRSGGRIRSIIAFSLGGAALIAGSVTGVMSMSKASDLKERCPADKCPPAARDDLDSVNTLANVANIALPIGAAALVWGLIEVIAMPSAPTQAQARPARGLELELTATGAVLRGTL
jgi:hypothetical protein